MRTMRTSDLGRRPFQSGTARVLLVAYYEEPSDDAESEPDVYYVALESDTPNIEVRKLRAKIRQDWKLGIKTGALLGKHDPPEGEKA